MYVVYCLFFVKYINYSKNIPLLYKHFCYFIGNSLTPLLKKTNGVWIGTSEKNLFLVRRYPNFGKNVNLLEQGPGSMMQVTDIPISASLV